MEQLDVPQTVETVLYRAGRPAVMTEDEKSRLFSEVQANLPMSLLSLRQLAGYFKVEVIERGIGEFDFVGIWASDLPAEIEKHRPCGAEFRYFDRHAARAGDLTRKVL